MNLSEEKQQRLETYINDLVSNSPKPGDTGMYRLSDNQKLLLCISTNDCLEAKEKFLKFVHAKGHIKEEKLVIKINNSIIRFGKKVIHYVYFHEPSLKEEFIPIEETALAEV